MAGRQGRTVADSQPWWTPRVRADGAPNVVVVLVDDLGFSDLGCYGSEIDTPHVDALAREGLRFTSFHATPICSPTRASLLTGLESHAAGVGTVHSTDSGYPGYRGALHNQAVTAAEVFRANGYATMTVGKWHLSERRDLWDGAPRDSWPLQRGFDRCYGFLEYGLTNLLQPSLLVEDNHVVPVDRYADDYCLTDDITDRAIDMIRSVKVGEPDRPFFLYFAHAAVHAPLMAKPADMAKYAGRFERGWDELRHERFAHQQELGIVPSHARLPEPESGAYAVPEWASLPEEHRQLFARYMEVYAAMVDNVDQSLGRLRAALAELGQLDNTVIMFLSDNGASREGGRNGTTEYFRILRDPDPDPAAQLARDLDRFDLIGGPRVMCHYPQGWARLGNTPLRMFKISTFAGGHQVPFVVSWPGQIVDGGSVRTQYAHVTDVLPTLIDLLGLEPVTQRDGQPAKPMAGTSLGPALHDPGATSTHTEQLYEAVGGRAYYRDGWEAVSPRVAGAPGPPDFDALPWHLFDLTTDPTQTEDLSEQQPGLVKELQEAWDAAAWAHDVYPLLGGALGVGGPDSDPRSHPVVIPRAAHTVERAVATNLIIERSFDVTIDLDWADGDQGILVAHGDQGTGYAWYVERDRLHFTYNRFGTMDGYDLGPLATGPHEVEGAFAAPGGGAWDVTMRVDGEVRAELRVKMPPFWFVPFEGIDVGIDRRSPVSWDLYERYGPFPYTGTLRTVTYRPGPFAPDASVERMAQQRDALAALD
jgi:arylsulfatase A-like enzyme